MIRLPSTQARPLVLVVCNALDDATRLERRITTDSPAASRKVFLMAQALRLAGVRAVILSLGRGRVDGSGDNFVSKVCRVGGVPIIYAPFSHRRGVSELLSLFGLLKPLQKFSRYQNRAVIFYNRTPAYLPLLREASRLGYRSFLDLEDGEVLGGMGVSSFKERLAFWGIKYFEKYCQSGALIACSALQDMTSVRPVHCFYGTAVGGFDGPRWQTKNISFLMSGTLNPDTGAPLLVEAISILRLRRPKWISDVCFEVTGKGESLAEFERLANEPGLPIVRVHGRTTDARYREILASCDVGLSLKPIGGVQADTTFPSKVMEFAGSGLLVLSTDISDVRRLLGDGARYLERNDPELLIERLAAIAADRQAAARCARQGRQAAEHHCAPSRAGEDLRQFLFGERA